ncbi:MAG: hypothetical protein DHS20C20_10970 [Ardenticatenaceae bacterium]|nr:MAG: hypothetical protein DHS20C20_10970 [Ardenticatenaceae bacterium]
MLPDPNGDGIYTFVTASIPAGEYETQADAAMPTDSGGGLPPAAAPFPELVVIPGTIQSVLGCAEEWKPDCTATTLEYRKGFSNTEKPFPINCFTTPLRTNVV